MADKIKWGQWIDGTGNRVEGVLRGSEPLLSFEWPHDPEARPVGLSPELLELLRRAGWAVVPMKPTRDMIEAGAPHCFDSHDGSNEKAAQDAADCWASMVGAAPSVPPKSEKDGV